MAPADRPAWRAFGRRRGWGGKPADRPRAPARGRGAAPAERACVPPVPVADRGLGPLPGRSDELRGGGDHLRWRADEPDDR
ncbi:hypothetical protein G6F56_014635 [Rhizopus delemar]|nr:hypothetical protein G6F56_014635 [Rhizopus delemar]